MNTQSCTGCHSLLQYVPDQKRFFTLWCLPARVKGKDQRFSKARITMKFTAPFCFTSFSLSLLPFSRPPILSSSSFRNVICKGENKPSSSKRIEYVVWMPSSLWDGHSACQLLTCLRHCQMVREVMGSPDNFEVLLAIYLSVTIHCEDAALICSFFLKFYAEPLQKQHLPDICPL